VPGPSFVTAPEPPAPKAVVRDTVLPTSKVATLPLSITSRLETSSALSPYHRRVALPAKVMLPLLPNAPLSNESVPALIVVPPLYVLLPVRISKPVSILDTPTFLEPSWMTPPKSPLFTRSVLSSVWLEFVTRPVP